jgi:hypothetical protein
VLRWPFGSFVQFQAKCLNKFSIKAEPETCLLTYDRKLRNNTTRKEPITTDDDFRVFRDYLRAHDTEEVKLLMKVRRQATPTLSNAQTASQAMLNYAAVVLIFCSSFTLIHLLSWLARGNGISQSKAENCRRFERFSSSRRD